MTVSRFDKKVVHETWRHERVPYDDPNHPFPGIMKAYGMDGDREVAVYVSDYKTKEDPIPNIMGKYLIDFGVKQFDEDGFYLGLLLGTAQKTSSSFSSVTLPTYSKCRA